MAGWAVGAGGGLAAVYLGLVTGALCVDVGVGRRIRPLGPRMVDVAAPREVVFGVVAGPYLGRTPRVMRAMRGRLKVLAEHFTPLAGGRLTAVTVDTVRFPGPSGSTSGWSGTRWGGLVAARWEATLASVKEEAERRAGR
ncbi:hypothetical protein IM697_24230 [Streptomyces ferrugineus]|uniref:Uncharacterized protein n=2 Tax=Streptomyces ferrugineus TaxID=1413221 RepID=A0A7M2T081_9ACTN|nr:hypothetical protein IM697_24230 [Streptomyces ferrugineus]